MSDFYQYDFHNTFDGVIYLFPYEVEDWYQSDVFYETLKYEGSDLELNYMPIVNYPVEPQDEHYESIIHPTDQDVQHSSLLSQYYEPLEQLLKDCQFDDAFTFIKTHTAFYQQHVSQNFNYVPYLLNKGYEHIVLYMLEHQILHLTHDLFYSAVNNNSQIIIHYIIEHAPHLIHQDRENEPSNKMSNIFYMSLRFHRLATASLLLSLGYSFDQICLSDLISVNVSPNDNYCYDEVTEKEADLITFLYEHLPDKNRLIYFIQDCLRPPLKEYFKQFLFRQKLHEELPEGNHISSIKL